MDSARALAALKALIPVEFVYKADPSETKIGFIAEDVPELVATNGRKGLSAMDIVGVLARVLKDQQNLVERQQNSIQNLEARISEIEK